MGIIRAAVNAVHGSLADQWLETVEPYEMGEHTVFTEGILVRKGKPDDFKRFCDPCL